MSWGPVEKRVGKRRQIRSVPMAWVRDPRNPDPWAADKTPDGRIVELSVSGAGMVAITHPYLEVGSLVMITCAGLVGSVYVRRIEHDLYPGESYYGVEFAEANSALAETLQKTYLLKVTNAPSAYIPRG